MSTKDAPKKTFAKKSTAKKPATTKASTEKARNEAIKAIDQRLAGGKQDHEVPSAKETANNAALADYAATKATGAPNADKAAPSRKPAKDAARANVAAHKRTSGLDLAARALEGSKEPLGAKALAERAIAAGWKTSGRTPEATTYSAIIREMRSKGKASRFAKAGRGLFTAGKA